MSALETSAQRAIDHALARLGADAVIQPPSGAEPIACKVFLRTQEDTQFADFPAATLITGHMITIRKADCEDRPTRGWTVTLWDPTRLFRAVEPAASPDRFGLYWLLPVAPAE